MQPALRHCRLFWWSAGLWLARGRSWAWCRGPAAHGMRHLFRIEFSQGELGIQVKGNPSSSQGCTMGAPPSSLHCTTGAPPSSPHCTIGAPPPHCTWEPCPSLHCTTGCCPSGLGHRGPQERAGRIKTVTKPGLCPPKMTRTCSSGPLSSVWQEGEQPWTGPARRLGPTGATASCPPQHTPALGGAWTQTSLPAAPRPADPSPAKLLQARRAGVPGTCRAPGAG